MGAEPAKFTGGKVQSFKDAMKTGSPNLARLNEKIRPNWLPLNPFAIPIRTQN